MVPAARRLLQQFARLPVPGQVKTRLFSELSPVEACAVHEELLLRTAAMLCGSGLGAVELWLDAAGESATVNDVLALGADGPFYQLGDDLGARMQQALAAGLTRADAVVLVGSDCPGLCKDYLGTAFAALRHTDVVLGPADDGGFVLIGCRRMLAAALDDIPWGTEDVLETTLVRLGHTGLSTQLLAPREDIDTPEDLRRWRARTSGVNGH
jgi:rSAM/selenodomain-associated transferase 1